MLDLTTRLQKPFELKLLNGDVLQLHKPSQKLLLELSRVEKEEDAELVVNALFDAFVNVLNCNMNGKVYTRADIEDYSIDLVSIVIAEYFKSVEEDLKK